MLHGTDPNYGTEINSLRAVSILNVASYLASAEGDTGSTDAESAGQQQTTSSLDTVADD